MTREEKNQQIEVLTKQLNENPHVYIADISELNSELTHSLREVCFKENIKLVVVKNTLLKKAMERSDKEFDELYSALKGGSSLMFSETGNAPAKLIKKIRKTQAKPVLKGAYVEENCYLGDETLEMLSAIKSKNELIADVIALLQSPMKNVLSSLQSGSSTIHGVLETLSKRDN